MEPRTRMIAFAGQKGGTGKSTVAVALAAEYHNRGDRVLLVDADPQKTALTWGAVAAEANLDAPTVVAMGAGLHRPDQLPALADGFDLVVIDCPGRHDEIQRSVLMVADLVVLPCGPAAVDGWALAGTLGLIEQARGIRPDLKTAILITRKTARTTIGAEARDTLEGCGVPILKTELGYRVAYQEAPSAGMGVTRYAPTSAAAAEVRKLADELEQLARYDRAQRQTETNAAVAA